MINKKMYEYGSNSSKIRELFEYGKKRKAEIGEDLVFDFSLGNPSVPSPSIVNETLIKLINESDSTALHGYTSGAGDLNVRKSIVEYLNNKYQTNYIETLMYLTVGAAASLTISLNAVVNPGDEVIVLAPFFPEYKVFIEKAGGKTIIVKSLEESFQPDFEELSKSINANTKAIIINSPNNPTGVILNLETIKTLSQLLKQKQEEYQTTIFLISDEPYRELVYGDVEVPVVSKYYDNTIVCYSFSKSLSIPGERIGYVLVNNDCINAKEVYYSICGAGRSLGFVCAPALFQQMIPSCLGYTADLETYKKNRDILYNALTSYGYTLAKPDGAFYLFMKALGNSALEFSEKAKEYELLLVPSDSFGYEGYIRIAYCVSTKQIENSLPAFKKLIDSYKNEE